MIDYGRIKCIECDTVIHVPSEDLPSGQSDELVEWFCPGCECSVYMKLS